MTSISGSYKQKSFEQELISFFDDLKNEIYKFLLKHHKIIGYF